MPLCVLSIFHLRVIIYHLAIQLTSSHAPRTRFQIFNFPADVFRQSVFCVSIFMYVFVTLRIVSRWRHTPQRSPHHLSYHNRSVCACVECRLLIVWSLVISSNYRCAIMKNDYLFGFYHVFVSCVTLGGG